MKIAVINFSGNVGKTTVARHLLRPRIDGAQLVTVESLNADEGQAQALRGRQFGEL
jgi:acyl CoA:acetate/3-ketoacid CoA transferase alpha subunit